MSSRFILIDALIFESRSTTCCSSRSCFVASNFSVAITCATELFRSGIRSRMSRIVCWRMSSGASVFTITPSPDITSTGVAALEAVEQVAAEVLAEEDVVSEADAGPEGFAVAPETEAKTPAVSEDAAPGGSTDEEKH